MSTPDFDHTSFAVRDALDWGRRLRRELGATPIAGEALPEFRYLLLYVGTAESGARIELIEPAGDGFLTRFIDKRGEGPHHITFTVPDLHESAGRARDLGFTVTGEDYERQSWQEAFIAPDSIHGVVIQLAQSDTAYPSPSHLLSTTERDIDSFPSSRGATNPMWWTPVWETAVGRIAEFDATHLGSTNLALSRRLFEGVLGAQTRTITDGFDFCWPSGMVCVHQRTTPGIIELELTNGPSADLEIGPTTLRSTPNGD